MNKPFKPTPVLPIMADVSVSISELKKNPAAVIAEARKRQVAITSRNHAVGYVVSPEVWDRILALLEDAEDERIVGERLRNPGKLIEVSIDDL
ncbi:MAG: type II toxin-antitoxin system Phd/YefM family antitoxin [Sphingomonadales bacterium]|nr:type II toxin-antitoxin system Phd/YefM family antitoxin [Sphingomonadales bacterium]